MYCRYIRVWNKWHIIEHLERPVNTSYSRVIRIVAGSLLVRFIDIVIKTPLF